MKYIMSSDQIFEGKQTRVIVRTIVSDIIKIIMSKKIGYFSLPDYLNEKPYYIFKGFHIKLSINLNIEESVCESSEFYVDAGYFSEEDIIDVSIIYNTHTLPTILYDLCGELNEVIEHELTHVQQYSRGSLDTSGEEVIDPFEYYSQPHEIEAQYAGFKRVSKLRGQKLEYVVKKWFDERKEVHGLSEDEQEEIINKIVNFKR